MKKSIRLLFLLSLSSLMIFSGCRRKPIEPQTEAVTEVLTEKATEKQTEKATEKQTEKVTEKQTTKQTEKKTQTEKQTTATEKKTSVTPNTTNQTQSASSTDTCPYCYGTFSTVAGADGKSEYSTHVAEEEAYVQYLKDNGIATDFDTDDDSDSQNVNNYYSEDGQSAQCPYCYQWFSTAPYDGGYSQYAEHVAAEEAYAAQQYNTEYYQCPYCGNWLSYDVYCDHYANGY